MKGMKASSFKIVPLPSDVAEAARSAANAGAVDHIRITVDSPNCCPCRYCLDWAQPGEEVILFPYAAIPPGHTYSETGPVFVHAARCQPYESIREYPAQFRTGRVFRAYDASYNMIGAEVANESEPEAVVEKLLQNPETAFVDARSVTRGCYTFRIERT